ncbi:hypothetical protein Tco_1031432 [Tanacetum coccineum]|uniref:Gag-Pol polyprotein n=1 Tax=Tanacetum coccineum TaxID=301880 RepID=A0ABQ5GAC1_9ASTR
MNYMQQPMPNPKDISDPTTARNMALNGLIIVPEIANPNVNPNGNGNVVATRVEGNGNRNNGNQIRIDLMAAAWDIDEIEEVNANCILMANLQQASRSDTQTEKAPTPTASITTADNAPTPTTSSSQAADTPNTLRDVDELHQQQHVQQQDNQAQLQPKIVVDNVPNAMFDGDVFENPFAPPSTSSAESSYQYVDPLNMHTFYQQYQHDYQWTKDHPLEQVIGEPSRPVLTRNQLRTDGEMCIYALTVSSMEPSNVKKAMTDPAWID